MTMLYKIQNTELAPMEATILASEAQLEAWIEEKTELIDKDLLIIGKQVTTYDNKRLDLLGLTRDGELVLLELKRDKTPREIIAQVLEYGSWAFELNALDVKRIADEYFSKKSPELNLQIAFKKKFNEPLPEKIDSHSLMIVASSADSTTKRIVEYLSRCYSVSINTVFFKVFTDSTFQYLATEWLMDNEEVKERSDKRTKLPWSGYWYVNTRSSESRSWDDMRKYNFIAAGGGEKYSSPLNKLKEGDLFYAYSKGHGYVGLGKVVKEMSPLHEAEFEGVRLLDAPDLHTNFQHDLHDLEKCEYVVYVEWLHSVSEQEALTFPNVFANQNIVCKLTNPETLGFLAEHFPLPEDE